jgi:hypothetical protein
LCLRHTQLRMMRFLTQTLQGVDNVPLPDFEEMIDHIHFDRTVGRLPALPSRYITGPAPPVPGATPPPTPVPGGGGGGGRGGPTHATAPPGGGPNANGTPVPNNQNDGELIAALGSSGKSVRQLIGRTAETTWPKDDAGTCNVCLAFSLVGKCFTTCRRAGTHRPLSAAEKQRVLAWVATRSRETAA